MPSIPYNVIFVRGVVRLLKLISAKKIFSTFFAMEIFQGIDYNNYGNYELGFKEIK
jgi:hypothetical protein